jgi:hypothetical protein
MNFRAVANRHQHRPTLIFGRCNFGGQQAWLSVNILLVKPIDGDKRTSELVSALLPNWNWLIQVVHNPVPNELDKFRKPSLRYGQCSHQG